MNAVVKRTTAVEEGYFRLLLEAAARLCLRACLQSFNIFSVLPTCAPVFFSSLRHRLLRSESLYGRACIA